jgi:hypothetical protein
VEETINKAYDRAVQRRLEMAFRGSEIQDAEETAKMDNLDEWVAAKNNDVRRAIILRALADDERYHENRKMYRASREDLRIALINVERVKTLIAGYRAGGDALMKRKDGDGEA